MAVSDDARAALRASGFFSRLGDDDFLRLEAICEEGVWPKGRVIFQQDEPSRGFYLVVEGLVTVYRAAPDGKDTILHLVGPPDCFAEAAIFDEATYPASAACAEQSRLLLIERRGFLALLTERPSFAIGLFSGMASWLKRLVQRVENLSVTEAPQRLARFLLDLKLKGPQGERYVELPAKKYLLAGQLGMTAPTFSRCLARLEEQGLVRVEGRRLVIVNPDGLDELAG
jgi:CRP/FNR family transcriptional regulator